MKIGMKYACSDKAIALIHDFICPAILGIDRKITVQFIGPQIELCDNLPLARALIDGAKALVIGWKMLYPEIDFLFVHAGVSYKAVCACTQNQFEWDTFFSGLGRNDEIKQRAQPYVVVHMIAEPPPVAVTVPFLLLIAVSCLLYTSDAADE